MKIKKLQKQIKTKIIFLIVFSLVALSFLEPAFSQASKTQDSKMQVPKTQVSKTQRLEWKKDSNAFEYKVQVRSLETGTVYDFTTDSNFIEFTLPAGNYEWQVTATDFLGRQQSSTNWQKFEIRKIVQPEIKKVSKKVVVDVSSGKNAKTEVPLESKGVESDASVELVNVKNGKSVEGKIEDNVAVFPKVEGGEWKLHITNKSGLETESEVISITDSAAEEKRLAEERAAEKAAEEAARKAEEKRLAEIAKAEEAEREKERAEREKLEAERLAEEKAAEEAERKAEKLAEQAERKNRPEKNFAGVYLTLGSGLTYDVGSLKSLSSTNELNPTLLSAFTDYSDLELDQKIFSSSGNALWYPFLGFLADEGFLHSYNAKVEYMPWKFSGFEAGFGLEFNPTVASVKLETFKNADLALYRFYQMELYPVTANAEILIPIASKRRWLGLKAGGGMLITHAYETFCYESSSSYYYGTDVIDAFSDFDIADDLSFNTKYGETYFINYMLQAGLFFRIVSYHGFVADFSLDYVYWNIADYSVSNLVANISIGVKI